MSDRSLMFLCAALAFACAAPVTAHAQQAAELRERLTHLTAERDSAEKVFTTLRDGGVEPRDSKILIAGPIRVLYATNSVGESELAAVRAGIDRGTADLRERFGADGVALLDSSAIWTLETVPSRRRNSTLRVRTQGKRLAASLRPPFDEDRIAQLVLQAAGARLAKENPLINAYAESQSPLYFEPARWEFAALELATSPSAIARRCATGSVAACRTALTRASGPQILDFYYEPGDHRTLVFLAPANTSPRDSAFLAERTRCAADDLLACTRIVGQVGVREPISASLRSTLLLHAMELGGEASIDRLHDSRADEVPVATLARVAGVSEDSLIGSWQRRVAATLADSRPAALPVFLSTALWCGLLLVGAVRRKP